MRVLWTTGHALQLQTDGKGSVRVQQQRVPRKHKMLDWWQTSANTQARCLKLSSDLLEL